MLSVSSLTKSYADQMIVRDLSFQISPGEHVGLIGSNGSGKTTLLRLLTRAEQPDRGSVFVDPNARLGYLPQGLEFAPEATLADALHDERADAALEVERLAETLVLEPNQLPAYQRALDRLEALGGYPDAAVRAAMRAEVLAHLGLDGVPLETRVITLSGGQKTRLGLARVLLTEPNLLLLDEPTNHLDLPMLAWLEDWLGRFRGAALIVSHDRVFLDRTINRVLYLDPQTHGLRDYAGNYSAFLQQSLLEREKQWQAYGDQQAEIARLENAARHLRGIAKFKRGGKADSGDKFAKGFFANRGLETVRRAKQVEARIEKLLTEDRIDKPKQSWQMKVDFDAATISGRDVLRLDGVSVGYGDRVLVRNINQIIRRGERIALIGENGAGKSTLVKTIVGQLAPLAGEVRLGASVKVGYFAQEQDVLDPASTPLKTLQAVALMNDTEARSFLHYFLFTGDQPLQPNQSLSYGERARLMLAQLVAQGCNFLLLDEPINHLDIPARTQFEQALTHFEGTALAVVHDRYFIQGFATRVWAVEGDEVVEYLDPAEVLG
ncbi:MAG: ABC-F family ATP-binding cassette domain-containing protein [Chloroflexi bacterium]|nr:ABC-F family ATP-binding cassette domain-containing protein [Chloroflexota bacterium]